MEKSGVTEPSRGRFRHRGHLLSGLFFVALLTTALAASPAFASKQVISSFGSIIETGSAGGEFNNPRGIAVNESGAGPANAGDVYVADEANNRIERFDANGNFVSAWGKDTIASSVDERQRIEVQAISGFFTLNFDGVTSEPFSAEPEQLRSYEIVEFLTKIPGYDYNSVSIQGGNVGPNAEPFIVTFKGAQGGINQPTLTADTSRLNGEVVISTIANGGSTASDTGTGFEVCTIAAECKAGTPSGENGALDSPQSLAVDGDTGNVYVSDRGNRRIDEYDGAGAFIRSFGFDVTESGPGNTGAAYEICNEAEGDVCKAGVAGAEAGQYGEGAPEGGFGIAVSPADGNAATGTVYLADSGNRRVDTFGLEGSKPGSFGSTAQFGEEQPRSIAVDSRGIVFASDSGNEGDVQRYDSRNADGAGVGFLEPILPPRNEQQEVTFTGFNNGDRFKLTCPAGTQTGKLTYALGETGTTIIKEGLEAACGAKSVAVSGETPAVTITFQGTLGGADQPPMTCAPLSGTGSCSVTTLAEGRAGPLLPGSSPASATTGLAVNPAGTILYVLRNTASRAAVVQQFGPAHQPGLAAPPSASDDTHGETAKLSSEGPVIGLAVDSAGGNLYIAVPGDPDGYDYPEHLAPLPRAHRVYVLNDSSSLPGPTVSAPVVGAVGPRSIIARDQVDPKGGFIVCKFQYSTDETNWTDVILPNCLNLIQRGGVQAVAAGISGLVPATHYYVRLEVTRPYLPEAAPVFSSVTQFTTATGPPVISGASVSALDEHSARINAKVDPSNSPTTYVVEYGTTPALGTVTAPISVGGGTQPVEIAPVIGGLSSVSQYYFKIVATNLIGSAESELLTTTTFPVSGGQVSCPNERFRTGFSAKLPDCRAYEQVTPNDKYGSDAYGGPSTVEASSSGDAITSYTLTGFPGSEGFQYANSLISRYVNGEWVTNGLNPPPQYGNVANVISWTPDLRLTFARTYDLDNLGEGYNLVMRDSADGSRSVLIRQGTAPGFEENEAFILGGAFSEHSKVVFEAKGAIPVTAGPAPVSSEANVYLYDRDTGSLTLAGLLPDSACANAPCVPSEGTELPPAFFAYVQDGHVVTPDGGIYFTDRKTGELYRRQDTGGATANTELVSASHKTNGEGPGGAATNSPQPTTWWGATPSGSRAFFTSSEELTNDANTGPEPLGEAAISRADKDGSGIQRKFIPTQARWVAVDSAHIYWTDPIAGTIGRAKLDGSTVEPNFIPGLQNPEGIAVDAGHIYWAEARDRAEGDGTIARATLAGEVVEKEFITGAFNPRGLAINATSIYWTGNRGIGRATISGENPEQTFLSESESERPIGIGVDANRLYFVTTGQYDYLFEYTLNGEIVTAENLAGHDGRGVAIDSEYVYSSDGVGQKISRCKLDLTNCEFKFIPSVNGVFGLAADAGHLYWANNLAAGDTSPSSGEDLYRYDLGGGLIDVVPSTVATDGTQVVGVLGFANDGARVYFAADADLDGAGPAQPGDCAPTQYSRSEFRGTCSIYAWTEAGVGTCATAGGCVNFVTTTHLEGESGERLNLAGGRERMKTSRVSADGRFLLFQSERKLTQYDNHGVGEFYRYDADGGSLTCITCDPTGAPPREAPTLKNPDLYHAPTSHAITDAQGSLSRNLSPDGNRFFFQSSDRLVPADINGENSCDEKEEVKVGSGPSCRDVYEWEAPETPRSSCTTASGAYSPADGGCIYLLSTGTGIYPSHLADVSESGDTVFIFSRQQLVPSDQDNLEDIYAVKVDGGLASQNAPRPASCEGDGCHGAASQPSDAPGAGSSVFEGPGSPKRGTNNLRCPKGRHAVRRKGRVRCVVKRGERHQHHKKSGHKKKNGHKHHGRIAGKDGSGR